MLARHGRAGRWVVAGITVVLLLSPSLLGVGGAFRRTAGPDPVSPASLSSLGDVTEPRRLPSAANVLGPIAALAPASTGGQGRLIVNSSDPAVVPNTGLRTNITNYFALPFPANSAFQVSAEETIGNYVAVFGIFQNDQFYPVPFFSVFSNVSDATVHLAYWSNLTLVGGQSYDFELTLESGTVWALRMNGVLFGLNASLATFDFQTNASTWAEGLSFSEVALYANTLTTPGILDIPLAFAVQRPGGWYLPEAAKSYMVTTQEGWGAVGRIQNGSLAPGELVSGLAITPLPNGTSLWTGGPVPVSVRLGLAAPSIRGTTIVEATASVYTSGGFPLSGVALDFGDGANSTFSPPYGATDATGFLSTFLGAPNVSASRNDQVTATVTLFGYVGAAAAGLTIIPPTQLFLNLSPGVLEAAAGSSLTVTVTAVDGSGAPGAGVLLLASVLAGHASVTPYTTTDAAGRATLVFTAPTNAEVVPLTVFVGAPGYWGHRNVNVTVRALPPTLFAILEPYVVGAGLALLAVGIAWAIRSRRRKLPPLPIPKLGLPVDEGALPGEDESVSRTPP
ncbi:MAG TPA: Ig-like domain-containing protein [Thermoplasmata archaeon]|nr:Ig-like domain-containing protein [Thermoplasmata archaeon]